MGTIEHNLAHKLNYSCKYEKKLYGKLFDIKRGTNFRFTLQTPSPTSSIGKISWLDLPMQTEPLSILVNFSVINESLRLCFSEVPKSKRSENYF